jgi:hypothetical protein
MFSGIFRTFSNTWSITKTSMVVLRKDKELLFFPVLSFFFIGLVAGIAALAFLAIGTFDRLDTTGSEAELQAGDIVVAVVALFFGMIVMNYFNAALMGAARHRLKGGDPNLGTGFAAVNKNIGGVIGWAFISTIIFVVLTYARHAARDNFIARLVIGMVGSLVAYMTFFVVPVLIVEGVGPIEAIKRSKSYLTRTWGEQFVSGFGFGILRVIAVLPGVILGVAIGAIAPVAGIIVAIPLVVLGLAVVNALEGIFKMALYEQVVENVQPAFFEREVLQNSFAPSAAAYRA